MNVVPPDSIAEKIFNYLDFLTPTKASCIKKAWKEQTTLQAFYKCVYEILHLTPVEYQERYLELFYSRLPSKEICTEKNISLEKIIRLCEVLGGLNLLQHLPDCFNSPKNLLVPFVQPYQFSSHSWGVLINYEENDKYQYMMVCLTEAFFVVGDSLNDLFGHLRNPKLYIGPINNDSLDKIISKIEKNCTG